VSDGYRVEDVDHFLYNFSTTLQRSLDLHSDFINTESGYRQYQQIEIDLTKEGEYAILYDDNDGLEYIHS
jgi:hypothetical protein